MNTAIKKQEQPGLEYLKNKDIELAKKEAELYDRIRYTLDQQAELTEKIRAIRSRRQELAGEINGPDDRIDALAYAMRSAHQMAGISAKLLIPALSNAQGISMAHVEKTVNQLIEERHETPVDEEKEALLTTIEELEEAARHYLKDRDHWKQQAEFYKKQAECYAQDKQTAELKAIEAKKIIEAAQHKLNVMRTVSPERQYLKAQEAADVLQAIERIDMYA